MPTKWTNQVDFEISSLQAPMLSMKMVLDGARISPRHSPFTRHRPSPARSSATKKSITPTPHHIPQTYTLAPNKQKTGISHSAHYLEGTYLTDAKDISRQPRQASDLLLREEPA